MHALLDQICMRICMRTDVLYIYIYIVGNTSRFIDKYQTKIK